jgi:hypothetical protein
MRDFELQLNTEHEYHIFSGIHGNFSSDEISICRQEANYLIQYNRTT